MLHPCPRQTSPKYHSFAQLQGCQIGQIVLNLGLLKDQLSIQPSQNVHSTDVNEKVSDLSHGGANPARFDISAMLTNYQGW